MKKIPESCLVPPDLVVADAVCVGERVIFSGPGIVIREYARVDSGSVVASGVTIGSGAWVKCGAVVLSSVPPNAIVEGNPARVVGYMSRQGVGTNRPLPTLATFDNFKHLERPSRVELGVGETALYFFKEIFDSRGALTVGQMPQDLPFTPQRFFSVYGVPSSELRGEHAHRVCKQFLLCLHGSCRVLLDDGTNLCEVLLDRPSMGVYMPERIWGTQYRYSSDAVLLVFASHPYDADDYLRTYDEFLLEVNRSAS